MTAEDTAASRQIALAGDQSPPARLPRRDREVIDDRPWIALPTDQPDYEILSDLTMEEKQALPVRFHSPVWSDSTPGAFICRVCWTEGEMVGWPCDSALKTGWDLFGREQQPLRAGQRVLVGEHLGVVLEPHRMVRVRLDGASGFPGNFPNGFVRPAPSSPVEGNTTPEAGQ